MFRSKGSNAYNPISNMGRVGIEVKAKLRAIGIKYIWQLVAYGKTEQQRVELAQRLDIPLSVFNTLVSRADLMRLHGVGDDLAYLLAMAGVSSCRELQHADPMQLHQ